MFTFIRPDINIDFMGARKKAFIFSGILTVVALVLIFAKGFSLGIDFRGGSSAIIAFKQGAVDDQQGIADSISALLKTRLGKADAQVQVQNFAAGAGDTLDGMPVDRFLVYLEITSLVDQTKQEQIITALKGKFGAATRVSTSVDAGDMLYITFAADADIPARTAELTQVMNELGFKKLTVVSDLERQLAVDALRETELNRQDREREGATAKPEGQLTGAPTQDELKARLKASLEGKSDKRFTVEIEALQAEIDAQLRQDFAGKFVAVESSAMVSPSVGSDLFNDGLLAILYSLLGILIYVTLRFDFRFAPGAVLSLAHDAIVTMGFIIATDMKFSLPLVASILTLIGYSINDTIIVYDRLRELSTNQKGKDLLTLINKATNQTLQRTLLTSGMTMLATLSILVFGGAQIRDFAICLFVGVGFGTYSSIYIALPFVSLIDDYQARREGDKRDSAPRRNRIARDESSSAEDKKKKAAV